MSNLSYPSAAALASFAIARVFHADHGVAKSTMEWALCEIFSQRPEASGFFLQTMELPRWHGDLQSALWGPASGDEPVAESDVHYASRGGEGRGASRMVKRPSRPTRMVTIIGCVDKTVDGVKQVTIYTCYGGAAAAQEPTDPSIAGDEARLALARSFWAEHALASLPSEGEVDAAFDEGLAAGMSAVIEAQS